MRIQINLRTCRKTGQCYYLHPELVKRGDDDYPVVLVQRPDAALHDQAEDMADICPTASILLNEDETESS